MYNYSISLVQFKIGAQVFLSFVQKMHNLLTGKGFRAGISGERFFETKGRTGVKRVFFVSLSVFKDTKKGRLEGVWAHSCVLNVGQLAVLAV